MQAPEFQQLVKKLVEEFGPLTVEDMADHLGEPLDSIDVAVIALKGDSISIYDYIRSEDGSWTPRYKLGIDDAEPPPEVANRTALIDAMIQKTRTFVTENGSDPFTLLKLGGWRGH